MLTKATTSDILNNCFDALGLDKINSFNICANHNKSLLLFLSAEMVKKPLWQIVWTQIRLTAPVGAVCSGSTLFASIGAVCNARQLFAADNLSRRHFQMHFFL